MRVNLLILLLLITITTLVQSGGITPYCNQAGAQTPVSTATLGDSARYTEIYHQAWELIKDNYYNRRALKDWQHWEHKFDGKLDTGTDLEAAVDTMVSALNDDYTYMVPRKRSSNHTTEMHARNVVQSKVINGNIGYLRLRNFYGDNLEQEFKTSLSHMANVNGYVLDLRGNHGGYIEKAQRLFALMADQGMFMTYAGFQDGSSDSMELRLTRTGWDIRQNGDRKVEPRDTNAVGRKPIIVLVNSDTRSAAELLTGALRQNNRAVVVGTRTFGKGVLQDRYELDNGLELKITTARYFLPNGENIHNKGLNPDLLVAESNSGDGQLDRAIQVLQRSTASASSGTESERLLSHFPGQPINSNSL